MSDWSYVPADADPSVIRAAQRDFRDLWNTMRKPPFEAAFDGTATDIDAMDYLHYEGFADPACGIEGAALVWGEVLRPGGRDALGHQLPRRLDAHVQ